MDTTTAARQAGVTTATIRTWCRKGAVAAVKAAGRWVIDAASLAYRISLTATKLPDLTAEFADVVGDTAYAAADNYNLPGLRKLLATVKARDIVAIMGRQIDPRQIRLATADWYRLERLVSFQIGCLKAEY